MKKILLVEDTADVREEIFDILEMENFKVTQAANAKIALEILGRETFDLIISDILMPEIDGIEFLKIIKQNPEIKNIPVILLSAKAEKNEIEKGIKAGAAFYLVKPVSPDILTETINKSI